jgi:hypothetical protein
MRLLTSFVACAAVALSNNWAAAGIVGGNLILQYNAPAPDSTGFHPSTTVPLNMALPAFAWVGRCVF